MELIYGGLLLLLMITLVSGIRIVRPTQRGLTERFGKYNRFANPGFHWNIPFIERMYKVNINESVIDSEPLEITTFDNINARVDSQVYFKVKSDKESVKSSLYNVNNYTYQIVNLTRTILREIIGTISLMSINSEREKINDTLHNTLIEETHSWGIDIVRTELKEIELPAEVQVALNKVINAKSEKVAATMLASARETLADGEKRAKIKEAEGDAASIKLVHDAIVLTKFSRFGVGKRHQNKGGESSLKEIKFK